MQGRTDDNAAPSTADREEIARFNRLATQWWDPRGPMWPLHRLNGIRVPFITAAIASHLQRPFGRADRPLAGLRVLDVGCGAGLLSESMASLGADVTGIDPAGNNIAIARTHARTQGYRIDYRQGVIETLGPESYDVVLNMEVVEHVDDLPRYMTHCCRLTRPGGLQFVATLNRNPLSFLIAIIGAEYVLGWLPRGTHQWRRFVRPGELRVMLDQGGLAVVERAGVAINPITRRYRLTRGDSVNYMVAARRDG